MNRNSRSFQEVDIIAQIADLKEVDYKNTMVITALIELLVEKGWITRNELLSKIKKLEVDLAIDLASKIHSPKNPDLH